MLRIAALFLFGTGFLQVVFSISIEAEPGESVTMWCSHNIHVTGNLHWFKQTNCAVPVSIISMLYMESKTLEPNHFYSSTKEHLVMYMHRKGTNLTIKTVSISDSGFYFCGPLDYHMTFGSGTRLEVKAHLVNATMVNDSTMVTDCLNCTEKDVKAEKNDTGASIKAPDLERSPVSAEECSGDIYYTLTLLFAGIIFLTCIIPLILAIIREHKRQKHKKVAAQQHNDKDNDSVEYAAVHFKRPKTAGRRSEDSTAVYTYTET